jgi:hypothetical protein
MFRPYNLTSLLAWTAGSLAGNQAYYGTKIKQARDKENTSPHSAQLAKEYCSYQESGGALGLEEWLEDRLSPARARIDVCRAKFGEFDQNLAGELIGSLSILEQKVEIFESAVQSKKISKRNFENIFGFFIHANQIYGSEGEENLRRHGHGFFKKYGNTIGWLKFCHEDKPDLKDYYETLATRFYQSLEKAAKLRPDLWETVQNEYKQQSQTQSLGIKMATWELVELPPNTKIY